jgi:mRNA interferase RelE/StbE
MPPDIPKYSVTFRGKAARQIQQLQPTQFRRIAERIDALADNPRPRGAKKLSGQDGYRLRVGSYRVLYTIDDTARLITVYRVKHRRDVYR